MIALKGKNEMTKTKSRICTGVFFAFVLLLMLMSSILVWRQCAIFNNDLNYYESDMDYHFYVGISDMEDYSLLNRILKIVYSLTGEHTLASMAIFALLMAATNGLSVLVLCYIYMKLYHIKPNPWIFFFALSSVLVGSFCLYGNPMKANVWHNPTLFLMRPAALGVIWFTALAFKNAREGKKIGKYLCANAVAVFFCMWAKPSFLMSFLPALGIVLLVDCIQTKGKSFLLSLKVGLSYAGLLPLLIYQYILLYIYPSPGEEETTSVYIKTLWTGTEFCTTLYKLVLSAVFIFVGLWLLHRFRVTNRKVLLFSWLYYAASALFHVFVKETGARASHGNFSWSAITMLYILMAFIAGEVFLNPAGEKIPRKYRVFLGCIYACHLITGVLYFWRVYTGGPF